MSEESAAAEIRQWKTVTDHALKNIFDLKENPVYQRIVRGDFTGRSAERAARDHQLQKDDLLKWLVEIQTQIERATGHLHEIGFLNRADKLKEIERILTQPVIIGDEVVIALAERQISTAASQTPLYTLAQAMATLTAKFDTARTLVGELEKARDAVYRTLKDAELRLAVVEGAEPALAAGAERDLLDITRMVEADPLAAWESMQALSARLAKAHELATTAPVRRARMRHELAAAHAWWTEWSARHRSVADLEREFHAKITTTQAVPPPSGDHQAADAGGWLADLGAAADGPSWASVEVGLRKWRLQVEACDDQDSRFAAAARALLDRRLELRGLLEALKSKVNALGLSEAPELDAAYQAAKRLLYQRPTPIEEAEGRVEEFRRLSC